MALAKNISLRHGLMTNVTSAVITFDEIYKKPASPKNYEYKLGDLEVELNSAYQSPDFVMLYDTTYLRGSSVKIEYSISQMTAKEFNNRASSFSIHGTACWNLYNQPNFQGSKEQFRPGLYPSALQLGIFFKNIGSIQKLEHC